MERNTKGRSHWSSAAQILVLLAMVLWAIPTWGVAADAQQLPALRVIGIIPVQAENAEASNGNAGWDATRKALDPMFSDVARSSRRFQTLHDELVRMNWESMDGRRELVDKYELSALLALSVSTRGDDAVMVLRLLGPKMETWLLESETVPRGWISPNPARELRDALERLTYRLINRIPVDVVVTSVQGRFLSLSGGEQQNVRVGDKVTINRVTIASTHPVHGSWMSFHEVKLGEAKVIDVKDVSSVAKIENLTYENAITVGDGARVADIAGRAKFARISEEAERVKTAKTTSVEKRGLQDVTPLFVDKGQVLAQTPERKDGTPLPPTTSMSGDAPATSESVASATPAAPGAVSLPTENTEGENTESSWTPDINFNFDLLSQANQLTGHFGPHVWSFSGPAAAKATFPTILINRFGGEITRPLIGETRVDLSADILYGSTSGGSYSGYQLGVRPYVAMPYDGIPYARFVKVGGIATATGLGVDGVFGGGDWVQAGGFAGVGGLMNLEGINIDWEARLGLMPLTLGRMGYDEKMRWIESSMGYSLDLVGIQIAGPRVIEWGGQIHYESMSATFADGDIGVLSSYAIQVLARYKL